jgi:hypothetical protein
VTSDPARERTTEFDRVLAEELDCIRRARAASPGQEMQLRALALSGGGVRSATFNLGVLQALCERGMLRGFDYLSTVSGGGYIGGWLSAQLRHGRSVGDLERALSPTVPDANPGGGRWPKAQEDASIGFLRQYSNYLTPRTGYFSIDTLAGVATYLRNVILIQSTLIALLIAVFLVPRVLHAAVEALPGGAWHGPHFSSLGLVGLGLVALALVAIFLNIRSIPDDWTARTPFVVCCVIVPAVAGAFVVSIALSRETVFPFLPLFWVLGIAYGLLGAALALLPAPHDYYSLVVRTNAWQNLAQFHQAAGRGEVQVSNSGGALADLLAGTVDAAVVRHSRRSKPPIDTQTMQVLEVVAARKTSSALRKADAPLFTRCKKAFWIFLFALAAGALGCGFIRLLHDRVQAMDAQDAALFSVSLAPFLLLLIFSLVVVIHLGLCGRIFDYQVHEWWARYGAWVLKITLWVGGAFGIAVYGPAIVAWAGEKLTAAGGIAWVATTLWGVLKGASPTTSGEKNTWAELLLPAAPCIFILGLALALAHAMHPALTPPSLAPIAMVLTLAVYGVLTLRLDINLFSLHALFRNRLTRCYLGAARMPLPENRRRKPHPFTGFDPHDDIALAGASGRPYHLINTTLNIASGKNLAWQQRKAASFFFSPLYCGFQFHDPDRARSAGGFAPTARYMGGTMLGSALAISGAAVSPNWGFHTSRPVAFLLTLFNLRVGRWCPNPGHDPVPRHQSPRDGGQVLLRELFALTDSTSRYVYLSDGGHFDNTGIYELVRRRAHLIVAVDCGEDSRSTFDDLADAVRKCQVDFGARIELNLDALKSPADELGLSKQHAVKGTIDYPAHGSAPAFQGVLILVKPTLTQDIFREAPDLLNYRLRNRAFPHHSTTDQWFDEAQFESYRKLGYLIGRRLAGELPKP